MPTSTRSPACSTSCSPGVPPFRRETEAQTLWAHMQEEPLRAARVRRARPVFARALAKEPDQRYEDCNAFVGGARAALGLGPSPIAVRRRRRRIGGRLARARRRVLLAAASSPSSRRTLARMRRPRRRLRTLSAPSMPASPSPLGARIRRQHADRRGRLGRVGVGASTRTTARGPSPRSTRSRQLASTFSVAGTPRTIVAAFDSLWVGTPEGRVHADRAGHGSCRDQLDASERRGVHGCSSSTSAPGGSRRRRTRSGREAVARSRASIRRPSGCDRGRARLGGRWRTGSAHSGCSAASSCECRL